mgnify:CR=1 FL=1
MAHKYQVFLENTIHDHNHLQTVYERLDYILLFKEAISNTTKIYDGFVIGQNGTNWNVRYNGQVHSIKQYGDNPVKAGKIVKVFIPQGNANLTFFM